MSRPDVSVCIVTCNQRDFIETCIRSIATQEAQARLHVLVGDDASDDGTSEIITRLAGEFPGLIQHLRREARLGAMANMRDLIARADGEFVARTDGDDYWLPGKLQRQLDYLQAHPDCAAVYTNAITVDEAGNRIGLFNDVGDARFDLQAMLRRGNFLNNSSVLFRFEGRQAWLDAQGPQIDYRAHLWHARGGWLGHIGEPLTAYRINTRGSMVAEMNDRVRELYWEAIQSVPRELVSDDDYSKGVADFLRRVFFRAARTGRWDLFRGWRTRAQAAVPCGAWRLDALTAASIARIAAKEATGRLRRDRNGKPLRVLYRR
jgi:glycosyltransferase involved in cell wall biosynthesis